MYIVFADDSKRDKPTRKGMGSLVAAGAILVQADRIKEVETSIEALCKKKGFPVDDPLKSEFKWSPGRELWMVIVAIDDKNCSVANTSEDGSRQLTHEQDATYLLFERIIGYSAAAKRMQSLSTIGHLNGRTISWRLV
jgi:hypothetical protein